jgi:hypothetical protein
MKNKKKSQGEIFGIALLFVVIIIGFIVYSQIRTSDNSNPEIEFKTKLLASSTLSSLLKVSTGCYIERSDDSLQTLISQCIYDKTFRSIGNPMYKCENGISKNICDYSKQIINETLTNLFNNSNLKLGPIPYSLTSFIEKTPRAEFGNLEFTNFGSLNISNRIITKLNYKKFKYNRVSSGPIIWNTLAGDIEFELFLYYR